MFQINASNQHRAMHLIAFLIVSGAVVFLVLGLILFLEKYFIGASAFFALSVLYVYAGIEVYKIEWTEKK